MQELGYQGSLLPICLVYMPMRILVHLCSSCLLINFFFFILLHLSFDCIVAEIVSFFSCKISGQEFPDSQIWVYSFHICGCDFCNSNKFY